MKVLRWVIDRSIDLLIAQGFVENTPSIVGTSNRRQVFPSPPIAPGKSSGVMARACAGISGNVRGFVSLFVETHPSEQANQVALALDHATVPVSTSNTRARL